MINPAARPVVVGVDGSTDSQVAAEWAAREADRRHVALRLVHAHLPPAPYVTLGYPEFEQQEQASFRHARALLAETAAAVGAQFPDVPVEEVVVVGGAAVVLVDESRTAG